MLVASSGLGVSLMGQLVHTALRSGRGPLVVVLVRIVVRLCGVLLVTVGYVGRGAGGVGGGFTIYFSKSKHCPNDSVVGLYR